jgi:inorganic pyrophosphatase
MIMLDRAMYTSQDYPFDYGFVPQTHWHDGDPLDVVLLTTSPLLPGILLAARPVGVLDMIDDGESDAKVIAVPVKDPRFADVKDLSDVNPHTIEEIKHFFETYKQIQKKTVTIPTIRDAKAAKEVVLEAVALYKQEFQK